MAGLEFLIIDIETNGLRAADYYHEVVEIGIIRAETRVQLWRHIKCEKPQNSSIDALAVTNKTLADLENGKSREEVVAECDKFFNEDGLTPAHRCIVGHNIISFDKKFLFALWESVGRTFPAHLWLDTMHLSKHFVKTSGLDVELKSKGLPKQKVNLHAACDLFGVKKIAAKHDAKNDSRNTYLLWKALVEEKKIDYLPFIKTFPHVISNPTDENEALDPALLDL